MNGGIEAKVLELKVARAAGEASDDGAVWAWKAVGDMLRGGADHLLNPNLCCPSTLRLHNLNPSESKEEP